MNKRRQFFLMIALLTGTLATGLPVTAGYVAPDPILLTGSVRDEMGIGISGVAVTDGMHVVRTDAKGRYRIYTTDEASFVYLTVPAGYDIPQDHHVAKFYQPIIVRNGRCHTVFILKKSARSDRRHYTIVWADPQINNKEQAAMLQQQAVPDTRDHARELMKDGPVLGISAGDIAWDAPSILPEYKSAVDATGIPFFQVLGNHDMDIHVRSDEHTDSSFKANFGPTWYSFNRGQAHYVVLDNVFYYSDGYNYIGYITERQFKWLEQDLALVKPGSLVFVSMHISAYTEEKRRYQREKDNPGNVTFNRKYLFELLKPFKAHLLTGHTHYNENRTEGSVTEHIHASLCSAWWTAPVCDDGTPGGYGVYAIDGDELTWYYKSLGFPAGYQFRLYNRGAYPKRPGDIAVNVWNWDIAWKVEWLEDGVSRGEMLRDLDFDADAVRYMAGPDKPGKYSWIEPRLTDHLFFATPGWGARVATVVVTDRFGRQQRQEIKLNPINQTN